MFGIPNEDFVVTLGVDFADDAVPKRCVYELFRGEQDDCMALMFRIATPSNDRRTIGNWWLQLGPTSDWETFLRQTV